MYSSGSEARTGDNEARERAGRIAFDAALDNVCDVSAERWKAEQRDWLVAKLRGLRDLWLAEAENKESQFSPDPDVDRTAKARTGGCARQLNSVLEKML